MQETGKNELKKHKHILQSDQNQQNIDNRVHFSDVTLSARVCVRVDGVKVPVNIPNIPGITDFRKCPGYQGHFVGSGRYFTRVNITKKMNQTSPAYKSSTKMKHVSQNSVDLFRSPKVSQTSIKLQKIPRKLIKSELTATNTLQTTNTNEIHKTTDIICNSIKQINIVLLIHGFDEHIYNDWNLVKKFIQNLLNKLYRSKNIDVKTVTIIQNGDQTVKTRHTSTAYKNTEGVSIEYGSNLTRGNLKASYKVLAKPTHSSQTNIPNDKSSRSLGPGVQFLLNNSKLITDYYTNSESVMISLVDSRGLNKISTADVNWLRTAKVLFSDAFLVTVGDDLWFDNVYDFVSKPEFVYSVRNRSQLNSMGVVELVCGDLEHSFAD